MTKTNDGNNNAQTDVEKREGKYPTFELTNEAYGIPNSRGERTGSCMRGRLSLLGL